MSPILGIYASSMQPALNASSYESIATVTVGAGGSSAIEFTSIPSTYTHLQVRLIGANTSAGLVNARIQVNGDTGSNYSWHYIYGDGSSAGANASWSTSFVFLLNFPYQTSTYNSFVIDLLDYKNTNKYKTIRALNGYDANGSGVVQFTSGLWQSTNAITSLKIYPATDSIKQYSHAALYGIKGA